MYPHEDARPTRHEDLDTLKKRTPRGRKFWRTRSSVLYLHLRERLAAAPMKIWTLCKNAQCAAGVMYPHEDAQPDMKIWTLWKNAHHEDESFGGLSPPCCIFTCASVRRLRPLARTTSVDLIQWSTSATQKLLPPNTRQRCSQNGGVGGVGTSPKHYKKTIKLTTPRRLRSGVVSDTSAIRKPWKNRQFSTGRQHPSIRQSQEAGDSTESVFF